MLKVQVTKPMKYFFKETPFKEKCCNHVDKHERYANATEGIKTSVGIEMKWEAPDNILENNRFYRRPNVISVGFV